VISRLDADRCLRFWAADRGGCAGIGELMLAHCSIVCFTTPDLSPVPGVYATFARDHEYKRHLKDRIIAAREHLNGL
jgi:hypothetical protein